MKLTKVAICIATYQRPKWLRQLLDSLLELRFEKNSEIAVYVIVIDNDISGSARAVAEHYSSRLPRLFYEIEPVQNISLARNKAVALARELACQYIAFVDDDEFVDPFWLDELLSVLKECGADMVMGPVIPVFVNTVPDWIITGGFFERKRYKTGERIRWGSTCNTLIKREYLDRLDGPFDQSFGMTGGEDTHLFERLYLMGACLVWSDKAVVRENVPPSRSNLRWILCRSHFGGNTLALTERALGASNTRLLVRLLKGTGRIFQGSVLLLPSIIFGFAPAVRSLTLIARGVGMITGICGYKLEEYKSVHGMQ